MTIDKPNTATSTTYSNSSAWSCMELATAIELQMHTHTHTHTHTRIVIAKMLWKWNMQARWCMHKNTWQIMTGADKPTASRRNNGCQRVHEHKQPHKTETRMATILKTICRACACPMCVPEPLVEELSTHTHTHTHTQLNIMTEPQLFKSECPPQIYTSLLYSDNKHGLPIWNAHQNPSNATCTVCITAVQQQH